ncbi:MAG TPA: hypothetical protein VG844_05960 [Terracidiphilus sp.]|nr:hypothetical protein [Terracidiphilus sp.]
MISRGNRATVTGGMNRKVKVHSINTKWVCLALLVLPLAVRVLAQGAAGKDKHSTCTFHQAESHFEGSCGTLFDQTPAMTLQRADAISSGVWRKDIHPSSVWSGDMTDQGYPNAPIELEIYAGNWGVLRTEYGWFPVKGFALEGSSLSFALDSSHEVKPNTLDLQIVRKASSILSTVDVWNRADNRKCPANARTWSIYCAMEEATREVTGGFHHRRPALQAVRRIVDERTAARA